MIADNCVRQTYRQHVDSTDLSTNKRFLRFGDYLRLFTFFHFFSSSSMHVYDIRISKKNNSNTTSKVANIIMLPFSCRNDK